MVSMTGYGRGKHSDNHFELMVEIKSVNGRYLDQTVRLPRELSFLEKPIRDTISGRISRGNVSVFVNIKQKVDADTEPVIDEELVQLKMKSLQKLRAILKIEQPVDLNHILQFEDILTPDITRFSDEVFMRLLQPALDQALQSLIAMKNEEGRHINEDLQQRLSVIEQELSGIQTDSQDDVRDTFYRLYNNVLHLIDEQKIDPARLEQEIAIISDRMDTSEERVRLHSHINQFKKTLQNDDEAGKRLTFLLQEMLREANTINSKTGNTEVQHKVIRIKEEIEKLREQAQNIE
ncbi:MAG: YicC family protein [Caldithrix sp.]|nr:YicC family protein [Caldithrix sp.]